MMHKQTKNLLPAAVLLLIAGLLSPTVSQSRRWREIEGKPLVKFNWGCSLPATYPGSRLNRIVRATMKREDFSGAGTWGDRAFVFDLNGDRRPEYFVPLDCGGSGNCKWGVYALNPTRFMGLLTAQSIYLHQRRGRYPDIITYIHASAAEGILETYVLKKGRYVLSGDNYPTTDGTIPGNAIPDFLKKARAGCETPDN